jgi:hypothetical protein
MIYKLFLAFQIPHKMAEEMKWKCKKRLLHNHIWTLFAISNLEANVMNYDLW